MSCHLNSKRYNHLRQLRANRYVRFRVMVYAVLIHTIMYNLFFNFLADRPCPRASREKRALCVCIYISQVPSTSTDVYAFI